MMCDGLAGWTNRFQTIVTHCAAGGEADVHNRSPALQFMVSVTVKKIRSANGNAGARGLDGGEAGVIIHSFVGQKNFLHPSPSHVQRRKIVQRARSRNAGEEQLIFLIPEIMFGAEDGLRRARLRGWRRRLLNPGRRNRSLSA